MATQREQSRESFRRLFIAQGASEAEADRLADVAVDSVPEPVKPKAPTVWVKVTEPKGKPLAERVKPIHGPGWDIEIKEAENLGHIVGGDR
jgi:hypothetical protein